MSAKCVECGTPLNEVPLIECAAHRAHDDMERQQNPTIEDRIRMREERLDALDVRIGNLPDPLELREILQEIVRNLR